MQYALSMISSNFIYSVACDRISYLLRLNNIPFYAYHNLLFPSSSEEKTEQFAQGNSLGLNRDMESQIWKPCTPRDTKALARLFPIALEESKPPTSSMSSRADGRSRAGWQEAEPEQMLQV
jgi:hypothetical protein